MSTPGFTAEAALGEGGGRYAVRFAGSHAQARLGVVPASCATAVAGEVIACTAAAVELGLNPLADAGCALAAYVAHEACAGQLP